VKDLVHAKVFPETRMIFNGDIRGIDRACMNLTLVSVRVSAILETLAIANTPFTTAIFSVSSVSFKNEIVVICAASSIHSCVVAEVFSITLMFGGLFVDIIDCAAVYFTLFTVTVSAVFIPHASMISIALFFAFSPTGSESCYLEAIV